MVMLHDEDEPHFDDTTIQLQLQQFFDEWHYRILHSGLALSMDRTKCLMLAMDIFQMEGMEVTQEEKEQLVAMEDESAMIGEMVKHLPMSARKVFEHFVLQLQLVVSTTTQVRHALEEGVSEEVARCFEGGDTGPGQQILKQCIVEAGLQIHKSIEMHKSWKANTETRIQRLTRCQDDAEHARQQLEAIQGQLDAFKGEQNAKSKAVLVGMADGKDKQLVHMIFSNWLGWKLRHDADRDIHDMFKKQIQDAEDALIAFKQKQLGISRSLLQRGAAAGDTGLQVIVLQSWYKYVIEEDHTAAMDKQLEEAQARLKNARKDAQDNTKKVMARMNAGNDSALKNLCWQSWIACMEEMKKDKEIDALAKAQESRYKEFLSKKSEEARGVLDRMSGSTDSGLVQQTFKAWKDDWEDEKKSKEMDAVIAGNDQRFKSLNMKQKGAAKSVASKCHAQEEENTLMTIFFAWATEARLEHIVRHYGGKLDQKKHQLDAVQTMFRSFANQLEQGMGNTPRTGKSTKSDGGKSLPAPSPTAA